MSRTMRWVAGVASATLLLGLVPPSTGHADDTPTTHHEGACAGDSGVTVVVDYQQLGGGAEVRCFTGDPVDGVEALEGAGFTWDATTRYPDSVVCRVNNRPAADEIVPIDENSTYTEDCSDMPPANGYWSYWYSTDQGENWEYSSSGIRGQDSDPGEWEGWSFSLNATASTNPEPRTNLALAQYRNAESTSAAADWIVDQWNPEAKQFAAGLADSMLALAAAEAHPEVVGEMAEAMVVAAPAYVTQPDSLAKVIIALDAAGQDTQHFLGCERDLTAELDAFIAAGGRNLDSWWGPHLVTIALNRVGRPVPSNVFDLLLKRQKDNGSFGYGDDTGLAISALAGIVHNGATDQTMRDEATVALDEAVAWAQDPANQEHLGGGYYWPSFSPANSTGILAGALADVGEDVSGAQAFMQAQQKLTGGRAWSNTLNGAGANGLATTQGIFAVAGTGLGGASLAVPRVTAACSAPQFTTQPSAVTATVGDDVSFTVVAEAHPAPAYTWELGIGGTWTTVNGETGPTLSFADVTTAKNGVKIRATASNSLGTTTSNEALLTVKPVATTPPVTAPPTYPGAIYTQPGYHKYNGRHWFTHCEPYSVTQRCRTLIEATTVTEVNGKFVTKQGWAFNNLTYLPSKKAAWAGNPLAVTGSWTAADGRQWRTECNTPAAGGNGCRSFATVKLVGNLSNPGQPVRYGWITKEIFNNIVQFS